jgi:hypothetical protein
MQERPDPLTPIEDIEHRIEIERELIELPETEIDIERQRPGTAD